ncbi:FmdB family zinc ribbon protein [Thermogemmata fonticola]|uniref:Zinc ribbon domain-containing protein n=1 Tax=Thermogemmata fonticola TaxID=2755323 RepID=A0A7V8VDC9_9BACT|nr:zinc ribbon domain-containing protein [Thermogemmata fonticola]
MPLYEYTCRQCQHTFEQLVPSMAHEPTTCPQCQSPSLERLIGLPTAGRSAAPAATNCQGDGPPCGAPWCGRTNASWPAAS